MNRFEDKVVIVTGAAGGIGRAAALRFGAEGAAVVAVDLDDDGLAGTVAAVAAAGGTAHAVRADVTQSGDVEAYVQTAVDRFGGVDVLFNNAGIEGVVSPLEDYPEDVFDNVMAVNVKGVWLGMRHVRDLPGIGRRLVHKRRLAH
ncbi:MAG: SDR family NAD(P)-dependent oxidoreductase, partial [bacterium]|nr:SDR family NAD(P)-dependent oxidoreductase [bacterium]